MADARDQTFAPTYDADFLGEPVAVPEDRLGDSLEVDGSVVVPYTHFCLALSRSRRMTRWAAWNIDDTTRFDVPRTGFFADPRIAPEDQVLDDAYVDNQLDRGHVVRRADVIWGPPEEGARASRQSFAFPNITPQMATFNQSAQHGVWGELEEAVLADPAVKGGRATLLAGPVYDDADPTYRDGVRLPRSFFKIVVYVKDGVLRARSFVLTQNFDGLQPVTPLEEFVVFAARVADVAASTGLAFDPALEEAERAVLDRGLVPVGDVFVEDAHALRW